MIPAHPPVLLSLPSPLWNPKSIHPHRRRYLFRVSIPRPCSLALVHQSLQLYCLCEIPFELFVRTGGIATTFSDQADKGNEAEVEEDNEEADGEDDSDA